MKATIHQPGETAGSCKLIALLGGSLRGEVWSAFTSDGHLVAVKFFSSAAEAKAEYKSAVAFTHPPLLHPLSLETETPNPFIILPYCKGRSIDNTANFFPEETAWRLMNELSSALASLHAAGIYHGDVNPSNILWDGGHFILSDFGSSAQFGEEPRAMDESSYPFAAPEQRRSGASDIWSLGASIFFLIMGNPVFNGMGGKAQEAASSLPFMRKTMPELSQVISRCLAFLPADRPSAEELAELSTQWMDNGKRTDNKRPVASRIKETSSSEETGYWPDEMKDMHSS